MGLLKRIKSLVGGFFGVVTGRLEEKNPEYLIADAENRIKKSRKEAEKQLVEIQTWSEMVRLDMREAERKLSDVRAKIVIATQEKDRNLLVELLVQEEEFESLYNERKRLHESAVAEALRVRDHYKHFESEMNSKLRELRNIRSQTQLVSMREKIIELDGKYGSVGSGYGTSEMQESLNTLRKMVNERCARVIATEQLRSENLEVRMIETDHRLMMEKASSRADMLLGGETGKKQLEEAPKLERLSG